MSCDVSEYNYTIQTMKLQDLNKIKLPAKPGVYFFVGKDKKILYIGKATSLRDRVRSYFGKDLISARGEHISNMIVEARMVKTEVTDSVLEALMLEVSLIKKYKPRYNTDEKDDKSFNHIIITKEDFPRVLIVRGRELANPLKTKNLKLKTIFGPFPKGGELREAIKLIRKIFPFRDKCVPPFPYLAVKSRSRGKPCFNRQIGLCPGVCIDEISKEDYKKQIHNLKLFLEGKTKTVVKNFKKEMKFASREQRFERAGEIKRMLFALTHIQDVALMKREVLNKYAGEVWRIEAYDAAHLSGKNSVAVMTVVENGQVNKNEYRKFRLRTARAADDLASLEEVLRRRFSHFEWRVPNLVVVDGGQNQKRRAEKVLNEMGISVPVVSVVKNEFHKPREILGDARLVQKCENEILLSNSEAHRFAIKYHRELRNKITR